jgi:hypothetical protein
VDARRIAKAGSYQSFGRGSNQTNFIMERHYLQIWLLLLGLSGLTACNRVTPTDPPPDRPDPQVAQLAQAPGPAPGPTGVEAPEPSPSDGPDRVMDESRMVKSYTEWTVSETAAHALGRMGAAAVPDLIESLHDQDPAVRLLASQVISRIGPEAVLAVPDLIELLNDEEERVRRAAIRALGQIGPDAVDAVPELVRLLREADGDQPVP